MDELINTIDGPVERSKLETRDIIVEHPGSRSVATEWYLDGRLVRRDAWVNLTGMH
jgi:hypothetical protein